MQVKLEVLAVAVVDHAHARRHLLRDGGVVGHVSQVDRVGAAEEVVAGAGRQVLPLQRRRGIGPGKADADVGRRRSGTSLAGSRRLLQVEGDAGRPQLDAVALTAGHKGRARTACPRFGSKANGRLPKPGCNTGGVAAPSVGGMPTTMGTTGPEYEAPTTGGATAVAAGLEPAEGPATAAAAGCKPAATAWAAFTVWALGPPWMVLAPEGRPTPLRNAGASAGTPLGAPRRRRHRSRCRSARPT